MVSYAENITSIVNLIIKHNPKKILDVGSAFGKYGIIVREALLSKRAEGGDLTPNDDIVVDCVEVAEYFQNLPYHKSIYNKHYHKDVLQMGDELKAYDLILLIDVMEHWTKEQFWEFYNKAKPSKILISTPKGVVFYTQEYYGPDCPKHMTQWNDDDFIGKKVDDASTTLSIISIL